MSSPTAFHILKSKLFLKTATAAVLPIPRTRSGFKTANGDFPIRTKRKYRPHIGRFDWPVTVLAGEEGLQQVPMPQLKGVRMRVRDVRHMERKGGLEATLVSSRPETLSPFGRKLRTAIFGQLHRLNDSTDWSAALEARNNKLRELESRRRKVLRIHAGPPAKRRPGGARQRRISAARSGQAGAQGSGEGAKGVDGARDGVLGIEAPKEELEPKS